MASGLPLTESVERTSADQPRISPPPPTSSLSYFIEAVDKLKFFLAIAPSTFSSSRLNSPDFHGDEERALNRFLLPTGELISCVLWNGLYHVTGTDIVRALNFRFLAFGRPVRNAKKFEEGVFSDLRNLKSGTDATLEEPKSEFLELLFKHNCIRTQKKQKVFYWFSVPHDRLFLDALDRDLKREKLGQESTTEAVREPALSFRWNPSKTLFEQFTIAHPAAMAPSPAGLANEPPRTAESTSCTDSASRKRHRVNHPPSESSVSPSSPLCPPSPHTAPSPSSPASGAGQSISPIASQPIRQRMPTLSRINKGSEDNGAPPFTSPQTTNAIFGAFSLFEGSPNYKQRKRPSERSKDLERSSDDNRSRGASTPAPLVSFSMSPSPPTAEDTLAPSLAPPRSTWGGSSLGNDPYLTFQIPNRQLVNPLHPNVLLPISGQYLRGHPRIEEGAREVQAAGPSVSAMHNPLAAPITPQVSAENLPLSAAFVGSLDATGSPRTYVCPLFSCGRLFKRLEHLKRHVRTHTSEKPYTCSTCNKAFARSDNLAAHAKIHKDASEVTDGALSLISDDEGEEDLCTITDGLEDQNRHDSTLDKDRSVAIGYRFDSHSPSPPSARSSSSYTWGAPFSPYRNPLELDNIEPQSPQFTYTPSSHSLSPGDYYPPSVSHPIPFRRYRSATPTIGTSERRGRPSSVDLPSYTRHSMTPTFSIHTLTQPQTSPDASQSFSTGSFQNQITALNSLSNELNESHRGTPYASDWSFYAQNDLVGLDGLRSNTLDAGSSYFETSGGVAQN